MIVRLLDWLCRFEFSRVFVYKWTVNWRYVYLCLIGRLVGLRGCGVVPLWGCAVVGLWGFGVAEARVAEHGGRRYLLENMCLLGLCRRRCSCPGSLQSS